MTRSVKSSVAALFLSLPLWSLTSCASVKEVAFNVETINAREEPLPCVIYRDNTLLVNSANDPLITPTRIKVAFVAGAHGSVKLGVRAVVVGSDGKIASGLREDEPSPYVADFRHVHVSDAEKQLYILVRNRSFETSSRP